MKYMSAMCPENQAKQSSGFALPTAIFLLVVLAALGAFMLTISSVQHTTSAQDVQGARAYQAARAGIEWGAFQIMVPENTNPVTAARAGCFADSSPVFGGTLTGFTVAVTCASSGDVFEGENTIRVFRLTSTASLGGVGSVARVERVISATVSTCRKTADNSRCDV